MASLQSFGKGDSRARTLGFPLPSAGSRVETPFFPLPQSPSPDHRRSGGQDFRTPSPQGSSPPVVPVAPVSPVFSLLGPSSRPSAQLSLGGDAKTLRFFRTTSPKATGGCGEFEARLSGMIPGARTPRRPDPGSYLEAALGLRARQAGALRTGAHGPCAPAGSPTPRHRSRRRAGAATRPGGGRLEAGSGRRRRGGGPAGGRRAGGSQGASERASEPSSARDSPALSAFILCPALLFPRVRGPAHLTCRRL